MCNVTKSSKEVEVDPRQVESTKATRYGIFYYFTIDNMVYMGTVNNSNNTLNALICVQFTATVNRLLLFLNI